MLPRRLVVLAVLVALVVALPALAGKKRSRGADILEARPEKLADAADGGERRTFYQVFGRTARRNHEVMGPVKATVGGVPAEPVDSFTWDGVGSEYLADANISMTLDPIGDTGIIQASWTDEYGDWTLTVTAFQHPHHGAGTRFGSSSKETHTFLKDPITTNSYLHGDTGSGQPVMPTLFTYVAAWGPANVTLNGVPFANPFEIPAPLWEAHFMVSEGARDPDGTVRTVDGGIYDPSKATEGRVDPYDIEVHLVFHDTWFPTTTNVPPLFSFFYHLVFENVTISITSVETPQPVSSR